MCGVDLKCCYSDLVRIGLVRILVCKVLNAAIFPETSKMILLFLVQMYSIGLNPSSESPTTDFHFEQLLFHFLVEHGVVNFS